MKDALGHIVAAISAAGITGDLGVEDILDAIWLSRWLPRRDHAARVPREMFDANDNERKRDVRLNSGSRRQEGESGTGERQVATVKGPSKGPPKSPAEGLKVEEPVPSTPLSPEGWGAAVRSLRRSIRRVVVKDFQSLDEPATVCHRAEQGFLSPVFRRRWVHRYDVALVVDNAGTMAIWHDEALSFGRKLRQARAFRDVQIWEMETTGNTVAVRPSMPQRKIWRNRKSLRALQDPAGRRLVLVLTDCGGVPWHEGIAVRALAPLARRGPVVLIQVLPEELWGCTALDRATFVRLHACGLLSANSSLVCVPDDDVPVSYRSQFVAERAVPFPVLELNAAQLSAVGRFISGGRSLPGAVWTARALRTLGTNVPLDAEQQLRRFSTFASSPTRRLARHLAAVAPLDLGVVRFVREALVPEAQRVHEAELVLSGILRPQYNASHGMPGGTVEVLGQSSANWQGSRTSREIEAGARSLYEFDVLTRSRLLEELTADEAVRTIARVAGYIEERSERAHDAHSVLSHQNATRATIDPSRGAFAAAAADILFRIRGEYAALVNTSGETVGNFTQGDRKSDSRPTRPDWLPDLISMGLGAKVPPLVQPAPVGTPIEEIFRRQGIPELAYVEPEQARSIRLALRTMGRGLVVEGPTQIGKSTVVRKALEGAKVQEIDCRHPRFRAKLQALLDAWELEGHLIIEDAHLFPADLLGDLARFMRWLADVPRPRGKVTLIGIDRTGRRLVAGQRDLAGRIDEVRMSRQPDEKIRELIEKGERLANVRFVRKKEMVREARGSFRLAQELCFQALMHAPPGAPSPPAVVVSTRRKVEAGPDDVRARMRETLDIEFEERLFDFVSADRDKPSPAEATPGGCFALLWLLAEGERMRAPVGEAKRMFPSLGPAFRWIESGGLESFLQEHEPLAELLSCAAGELTAQDPRLDYYLSVMDWKHLAKGAGIDVDLQGGELVFGARSLHIWASQSNANSILNSPEYPWGNPRAVLLRDLLMGAYPAPELAVQAAQAASIPLERVRRDENLELLWNEILECASRRAALTRLLRHVRADVGVRAYWAAVDDCVPELADEGAPPAS